MSKKVEVTQPKKTKQTNELIQFISKSDLEKETANSIQQKFMPIFEKAAEWKEKSMKLVVTNADQKELMKEARSGRLFLKALRVQAAKDKNLLKEDSIRYGRAVQGAYNLVEYLIVPIEKHLKEQEDFILIQEQKKKDQLKEDRESQISHLSEFIPVGLDFGNMSEEDFQKLLNGANIQFENKKKAEADRIAKMEAEAKENQRIREENDRLRKEAEAREKELEKQRKIQQAAEEARQKELEAEKKKIEAAKAAAKKAAEAKAAKERKIIEEKLEQERQEKMRLEAEIKAKKELEERQEKERVAKLEAEKAAKLEAERKALNAPDKEKIMAFAASISKIEYPVCDQKEAQAIIEDFRKNLQSSLLKMRVKASDL